MNCNLQQKKLFARQYFSEDDRDLLIYNGNNGSVFEVKNCKNAFSLDQNYENFLYINKIIEKDSIYLQLINVDQKQIIDKKIMTVKNKEFIGDNYHEFYLTNSNRYKNLEKYYGLNIPKHYDFYIDFYEESSIIACAGFNVGEEIEVFFDVSDGSGSSLSRDVD